MFRLASWCLLRRGHDGERRSQHPLQLPRSQQGPDLVDALLRRMHHRAARQPRLLQRRWQPWQSRRVSIPLARWHLDAAYPRLQRLLLQRPHRQRQIRLGLCERRKLHGGCGAGRNDFAFKDQQHIGLWNQELQRLCKLRGDRPWRRHTIDLFTSRRLLVGAGAKLRLGGQPGPSLSERRKHGLVDGDALAF